ncbi:Alpha/Beta hydrolase protein [Mycena rebaudengoi]|nr:Alpha/Beta hydrolase protein [Mycena rebaudengoi]
MLLAAHAQTGPTVNLGYAEYQGTVNSVINITNFLGIRYAAAPLGELRFRSPQPPANVSGVQLATTQPNQCLQAAKGTSNTNPLSRRAAQVLSPEDCLFLNVYHPSHVDGTPSAEGLPTLVWIHRGGYLYGVARDFNGEDIILQSNRGVVVVIIQYRLGLFSFLPGAAVNNNGTLNAGLLDQDFALRWVNRHISKFGGDPAKVTIWGESAGDSPHIIANNGQTQPPLFRGAIASSPFLPSQYRYNDRIPELIFSQIANQANCSSAAESMACLRDTDVNTLQTINTDLNLKAYFGTFFLVPVIDGTFITQSATKSLAEGKVNEKALLVMTNTFEGKAFVNQGFAQNARSYALSLLFPKLTEEQADTVTSLYAGVGNDLMRFRESVRLTPAPFPYLIADPMQQGSFAVPPGGHGRDVRYYFPSQGPLDFPNSIFINAFAQSFTSFIISLDPNVKVDLTTITPPWSLYSEGNTDMLFNRTVSGVPVVEPTTAPDDLLERCRCAPYLYVLSGPLINVSSRF